MVAEMVSNTIGCKPVRVRVPLPAPNGSSIQRILEAPLGYQP